MKSKVCLAIILLFSFSLVSAAPSRLTLEELKNAEYEIFPGEKVRLRNGLFAEKKESFGAVEFTMLEAAAFGDLDDDRSADAAVILSYNGGGSGSFYYLVAVLNKNGQPQQAASQDLGDRVDVKALSIENKVIEVKLIVHGPDDARCCPTQKEIQEFELRGQNLKKLERRGPPADRRHIARRGALLRASFIFGKILDMANTKSAQKAIRGSARKRAFNIITINKYKDAVKTVRKAVVSKKKDEAVKALENAYAQLDKAAQKHVIHANKAARLKSRLSQAIAKL